jgi:hypothetical protein
VEGSADDDIRRSNAPYSHGQAMSEYGYQQYSTEPVSSLEEGRTFPSMRPLPARSTASRLGQWKGVLTMTYVDASSPTKRAAVHFDSSERGLGDWTSALRE